MSFEIHSVGKKKKKSTQKRTYILLGLIVFCIVFLLGSVYVIAEVRSLMNYNDQKIAGQTQESCGLFGCVQELLWSQGCSLKATEGKTNILLLGKGGNNQKQGGSLLTDTIMIASFYHDQTLASLISIPRDLWLNSKKVKPSRINSIMSSGESVYGEGKGITVLEEEIERAFGLTIHYYAMIDFKAFTDLIDTLGGVDVNVETGFTDRSYPDGNFGYMVVKFAPGLQTMNGKRALQYVRSRHGSNGEASDFARSKRQQLVIAGIKDKLFSVGSIFKAKDLFETFFNNYNSNIPSCEALKMARFAKDVDMKTLKSLVLDNSETGVLYTPTDEVRNSLYGGAYVLIPEGNSTKILAKTVDIFQKQVERNLNLSGNVVVLNGTKTEGLAGELGDALVAEGVKIQSRKNTFQKVKYPKTLIIDLSPEKKYADMTQFLQKYTGGEISPINPEPESYNADVLLIVGADFADRNTQDTTSSQE